MTVNEQIHFLTEYSQNSINNLSIGVTYNNPKIILRSSNSFMESLIQIGLLKWRQQEDPTNTFDKIINFLPRCIEALTLANPEYYLKHSFSTHLTAYVAYLTQSNHPKVNLDTLEEQPKIDGYFGNVILGYNSIEEWSHYQNYLPNEKRYDLTRQTNQLYADLLSGKTSPESGTRQGEDLWRARKNHPFFDTLLKGYGNDNENMVDYQLGAILKKIGSTVPTVHAWRW